MRLYLTVVLSLAAASAAHSYEDRDLVVAQPNAPLILENVDAWYGDRVNLSTKVKNTSQKLVVAYELGLIGFNPFDDLERNQVVVKIRDVKPGKSDGGSWQALLAREASHYTVLGYVSRVRFADGTIWEADLERVLSEVAKISLETTIDDLRRTSSDEEDQAAEGG